MIEQKVEKNLREAIYSRDEILKTALRLMLSELTKNKKAKQPEKEEKVIASMIKRSEQSMQIYLEQDRQDLAKIEEEQIKIYRKYMPEEISDVELKTRLIEVLGNSKAEGPKQLGTFLKDTIGPLDGLASRKRISEMSKLLLAAYAKRKESNAK